MAKRSILFRIEPTAVVQVGVKQIAVTEDGVMVITLSNGKVIQSPSLKGPKGDTGTAGRISDVLVNGESIVDPDGTARFSTVKEDQAVEMQTEVLKIISDKLSSEYVSKEALLKQIQDITTQLRGTYAQLDANYRNSVQFVQTFLYNFQNMLLELNKHLSYDNTGVTLGNVTNFKVSCTNDNFIVSYKGIPYIKVNSSGVVRVYKLHALDEVRIGDIVLKNTGSNVLELRAAED